MTYSGAQIFCEVLAASGVKYLFGNPGSTELPLMDALVGGAPLDYILAAHEIPAMAMADGYAQASRTPGVVNVHVSCGVGNAMGMLYNAWCSGSPLILTAGQQDRRLRAEEPVLDGDLIAVTRPWTKWSAEVQRVEDMSRYVRRAVQEALTPPTGPVFLSLPVDLQAETTEDPDLRPASLSNHQCRPPAEALDRAAKLLLEAQRPVVLAGSRVTEYGACDALARLAESAGAPVYSDYQGSYGRLPIAADHPLYAGGLGLFSPEIRRQLERHDVIVVAGMDFLRQYIYHEPANPISDGCRLIQIDINSREIAKNYPVDVGIAGDMRVALDELSTRVDACVKWEPSQRALERRGEIGRWRERELERLRSEIEQERGRRPMAAEALIASLARVLPPDAAFIEEAPTTNRNLLARLGVPHDPTGHFSHRGWALGWGMGCALGVKLAWPERVALALIGDGSALYGIQGLWTAARYRIPVVFVVANNSEYRILKTCSDAMKLPQALQGRYESLDLSDPAIDYVTLAHGFGVEAARVEDARELEARLEASLNREKPLLLEAVVE